MPFKNKAVELIARAFIKIFRCTPFMVQVYLAYYGLPALGLNVSAFSTGVIILGMYTAAYTAVILESGTSALFQRDSLKLHMQWECQDLKQW